MTASKDGGRIGAALLATALIAAAPVPGPADIYGPLYEAVELGSVFADSKTFADAVPRRAPAAILADYARLRPTGPALATFVRANFTLPAPSAPAPAGPRLPLRQQIARIWPALTRQPMAAAGSALALPRPFVVPGGRFREIYYWDSYFTMIGLARDGRGALVEDMIDDFTALIERYGHISNGTRSYYLSRSQPPVYYLMLALSSARDPATRARRLAALRREHAYWMRGEDRVKPGEAIGHVLRLPDGSLLNRYWDARATPRDESYREDVLTARRGTRPSAEMWRNLRAGAESGWDYSSRWLADRRDLATIRTVDIAPVDLNSLMTGMERAIAVGCARTADTACAADYARRADQRATAIRRHMWDGRAFADIDRTTARPTGILSAAALFPLFAGIATPAQAHATAATIRARLLAPGGLRTTAIRTGQQWDAPNGWAPLQWIGVTGLRRYGEGALARTIAARWIATVTAGYRRHGALVEKYDVETGATGTGGEYVAQTGFGWTNGVTAALIDDRTRRDTLSRR